MNFIANETAQKLRGGFYTEPDIAAFIAQWVLEGRPESVLEPSCGDGAFLDAILSAPNEGLKRLLAFELAPEEAEKARARAQGCPVICTEIRTADFLKWYLFEGAEFGLVGGVVGNPPFIRYQYLPETQQFLAEKVFHRFGLPFTKHTNAWVPFVIASISMLTPGGRLGMVIPSEIFHIRHAQALRTFLLAQCSKILILDPEQLWFENALQGVVLLLAEKKMSPLERSHGVAVRRLETRASMRVPAAEYFGAAQYAGGPALETKWMPLFLSDQERSLLAGLRADTRFTTFVQNADVDIGIVTGSNNFFLVRDSVVKQFELERWAHPMFGRSEHVAGLIYADEDHQTNRASELPTNFLWFDAADLDTFPPGANRYLRSGEEQGLPKRFKCRVRHPWFRVPSVYSAPVAMLKRCHHFPRLVLNRANAFTTDTAYRIKPRQRTAAALVYSFVNSLTCLYAELEGRHYGGGVLELVPSEIERLLLPRCAATKSDLEELDSRFRARTDDAELLREQDAIVLSGAGVEAGDQAVLHGAWDRLRKRRQRSDKTATIEESTQD